VSHFLDNALHFLDNASPFLEDHQATAAEDRLSIRRNPHRNRDL
jgi:hypothetical protein